MKTRPLIHLNLGAIVVLFLGCSLSAQGSNYPDMDESLSLLQKADGMESGTSPDDSQVLTLLQSALTVMQNGGSKKEFHSHRAFALKDLEAAIAGLQSQKSPEIVDKYIKKTILEIQRALAVAAADAKATSVTSQSAPAQAASAPVERTAPTVNLTAAQTRAVVVIKGDHAEGTGFLVKTTDGPTVITNIHVISNNPNLKILTNTGQQVTILSLKGALDRDLAMFAIKDQNYSYFNLAPDVSSVVQSGDEVVTPGNSEGGEVVLNTGGKVLGIGPDRIEFSNPVYHGNSGGPVFHTKSGQVVGVVSMGLPVIITNDLDKTSFQNRNSAIASSVRYFGLRVDNVPKWEPYDWDRLQTETLFLDQFHKRTMSLDAYLNTPKNSPGVNPMLYLSDDQLKKAIENCVQQASGGADDSQRKAAYQELLSDLAGLTDADLDAIQQVNNFYTFDQKRAAFELTYRQNLKKELDFIGNDLERLGYKPLLGNK